MTRGTVSERRSSHRVTYPPEKRGELKIGNYSFQVVDISRQGIRFLNPEGVKISEWIGASITLHDGSSLPIEGKIIWTDDHLLGLQLLTPIPNKHLLDEQCYLIQEGISKSTTKPPIKTIPRKTDLKIYLVQHGEPVSKEIDQDRPLSEKGREDIEKVGRFLKQARLSLGFIVHSGKTRAVQTANVLGALLVPQQGMFVRTCLGPNDPVETFLAEAVMMEEDIMVVGHLPFLSRFAEMLLGAREGQNPLAFTYGGVVCLGRGSDNSWRVDWMVVPGLFA